MKRLVLLLTLGCLLNARAISLPDGPEVGQPAPSLKLPTWLQAPPEASQGWPAGKVIVLEFWSTTCGPCVAYIPHLNDLAAKFKDKPVQFIAVTDDKESVVRRFLKKTPIKAWLGLGPDAGFGEDTPYRVWAIPHTVLIDAHGRIAAITDPDALTAARIQSVLDGRPAMPTVKQTSSGVTQIELRGGFPTGGGQIPGLVPGQYKAGIKPIFQVMIRAAATNSPASPPGGKTNPSLENFTFNQPLETWLPGQALTLQNDPLKRAIEVAYDVNPSRIVAETKLPKEKYDFYITLPEINDQPQAPAVFEAVFAQAVASTFGLTVKRERRNVDVLALRANANSAEALSKSTNPDGKYSAFWNEAAATNQPLSILASELETSSGKPVFDETGLAKPYDFDIKWDQKDYAHPNIKGMTAAVKTLGLDLVQTKKSLEVIVVTKSK